MSADADFAAVIERAANAWLRLDPRTAEELRALDGKVIGFDVTTFDKRFFFFPAADGTVSVKAQCEGEPDTLIKAHAVELFRLAADDEDAGARAEISGDVNLGRTFQRIFQSIEFDWEECLAPWLGDAVANELGLGARRFSGWLKHCGDSFAANAGDYLRDEARLAVTGDELESFIRQVDQLRDAVERCEAKFKRAAERR